MLGVKQATENKRQFDEEVSIFGLKLKIFMWRIEIMLIADVLGTESWPEHDWLAIWNQQGCLPGPIFGDYVGENVFEVYSAED